MERYVDGLLACRQVLIHEMDNSSSMFFCFMEKNRPRGGIFHPLDLNFLPYEKLSSGPNWPKNQSG